jgi:hypothetical protein
MPKFIFSNSSYLVSFNAPPELQTFHKNLAKEKKFKVAEVVDIDDFLDTIDRVKYFIDIYLFLDGIDQDSVNILFNALGPLKLDFILFNPSRELDIPEKHLEKIVFGEYNENFMRASFNVRDRDRMPGGLNKFSVSCANYIFPFIFKDIQTTWNLDNGTGIEEPDYMTVCENSFDSTTGRFVLRVDEENLRSNSTSLVNEDPNKLEDYFREFMNQYIGVVNYNFTKIDIKAKISIPQSYDRNSRVQFGKIYFPEIVLKDEKNIFSLTLGYIDHEGKKLFDLTEIPFEPPSSDVEFL